MNYIIWGKTLSCKKAFLNLKVTYFKPDENKSILVKMYLKVKPKISCVCYLRK